MKTLIRHPISEGYVDSISLPPLHPNIPDIPSTREELSKPMERRGHNSISRVEGFFDTITMVDIHIYVEDSGVNAGLRVSGESLG